MGRILYDEISKHELVSSGKSPEHIIGERHGGYHIMYATAIDDMRQSVICWYHYPKFGEPVVSAGTDNELNWYGIGLPRKVLR